MKKITSLTLALLLTLTMVLGATAYPQGGNKSWSKEINKGGKNIQIKKGPNGEFEKTINGETVVKKDGYNNYTDSYSGATPSVSTSTPDTTPAPTITVPETPAVPVAPEAAPAPAPAPAPAATPEVPAEVTVVLNQVNLERSKIGAAPLTLDPTLTNAATVRAGELSSTFSHTRPDGSKWSTALDAVGVINVARAENIAKGQASGQEVMDAWINSSGHATNILNNKYTKIGIGLVDSGNGLNWVQLFSA